MDEAVLKPVLNHNYRCIANSEPDESAFTLPAYGQTSRKIYKNHPAILRATSLLRNNFSTPILALGSAESSDQNSKPTELLALAPVCHSRFGRALPPSPPAASIHRSLFAPSSCAPPSAGCRGAPQVQPWDGDAGHKINIYTYSCHV